MKLGLNTKQNISFGDAVYVKVIRDFGCPCERDFRVMDFAINDARAISKEGTVPVDIPGDPYAFLLVNGPERAMVREAKSKIKEISTFFDSDDSDPDIGYSRETLDEINDMLLSARNNYKKTLESIIESKTTKRLNYDIYA